jgi:hypothetical protein
MNHLVDIFTTFNNNYGKRIVDVTNVTHRSMNTLGIQQVERVRGGCA